MLIYGLFNYNGQFTFVGNEQLDRVLREMDPLNGIRSFQDVNKAMVKHGFELVQDYEVPAHNHMLVFSRLKFVSKR